MYVETNFCFPRGYHLVGTLTRRSILPVKASITMDTTLNFHGYLQALFTRVVFLYRPQTKLRKCNVFTPVCDSVQGGRGVHTSCRHTPHPPPLTHTQPGRHPPPTATAVDGMHPTGMHSCFKKQPVNVYRPQGKVMFLQASVILSTIGLMLTWSLLILVGYSVTCYGAVGTHSAGMLSC